MPYIKKEDRTRVDKTQKPENAGELNYYITTVVQNYIKRKGLRYQNINDILGALEGVKFELYRRVAESYEDEKIDENGDVLDVE